MHLVPLARPPGWWPGPTPSATGRIGASSGPWRSIVIRNWSWWRRRGGGGVSVSLPHGAAQFSGGPHPDGGVGAAAAAPGRGPGGRPGDRPPPGAGAGLASGTGGWRCPPSGWPKAGWWAKEQSRSGRPASASPLIWQGKAVGLILRTRKGSKAPLSLPRAPHHPGECREITLGCVTRYRIPLPLRQADQLSRRLRAESLGQAWGPTGPGLAVASKSHSR